MSRGTDFVQGLKPNVYRGLNVGAKAPTPLNCIYEMASGRLPPADHARADGRARTCS